MPVPFHGLSQLRWRKTSTVADLAMFDGQAQKLKEAVEQKEIVAAY